MVYVTYHINTYICTHIYQRMHECQGHSVSGFLKISLDLVDKTKIYRQLEGLITQSSRAQTMQQNGSILTRKTCSELLEAWTLPICSRPHVVILFINDLDKTCIPKMHMTNELRGIINILEIIREKRPPQTRTITTWHFKRTKDIILHKLRGKTAQQQNENGIRERDLRNGSKWVIGWVNVTLSFSDWNAQANEVCVSLRSILVRTRVYPRDSHYICRLGGKWSVNHISGKYSEGKKRKSSLCCPLNCKIR